MRERALHAPPLVRVPPRALAGLVLAAVALASGVAGIVVDRLVLHAHVHALAFDDHTFHPLSSALRSPTDAERRQLRAELTRELHLTAAQDSAIDAIMRARSGEFNALREEIRPRVERLVADVRSDIERVLTPAQRDRFAQLQGRGLAPERRLGDAR